jgi:vancomycin permeability regulator SanA
MRSVAFCLVREQPAERRGARFPGNVARGFAAFIGGFTLLNVVGARRAVNFDASHWWINAELLPAMWWQLLLLAGALSLIAFAVNNRLAPWRRYVTALFTTLFLAVTVINGITFYGLLVDHRIEAAVPVPLSFLFSGALALILWSVCHATPKNTRRTKWKVIVATTVACALLFPLTQIFFFGKTDYRRRADVAVVFGARAYASGKPSDALADRVRTACDLYREGTVSKLIFSGGPGDGAIHETESMRRFATDLGVNEKDIVLDAQGLSTQATVKNTIPLIEELGGGRVLAVSHYFHLPRIKMTYQRGGVEVYTIPAKESYLLRRTPLLLIRETAAWWVYYLRPLF